MTKGLGADVVDGILAHLYYQELRLALGSRVADYEAALATRAPQEWLAAFFQLPPELASLQAWLNP